jgi:hypothetical protein
VSGQFTEVESVDLTRGETFIHTVSFHDFLGRDVRIFVRLHLTVVDGTPVVDRDILKVTGCP